MVHYINVPSGKYITVAKNLPKFKKIIFIYLKFPKYLLVYLLKGI